MKKTICFILAFFLLVMTPIKGYAASAPLVFGLGEEVILPFLLSLLGVQAVNQIDSYDDLVSYNDEVYDSLIESLSGLVGFEAVQAWLLNAVQGTIETNSVIWEKLKEIAISNYTIASSDIVVDTSVSGLNTNPFNFYYSSYGNLSSSYSSVTLYGSAVMMLQKNDNTGAGVRMLVADSVQNSSLTDSYTFNGKTVYYGYATVWDSFSNLSFYPTATVDTYNSAYAAISNGMNRGSYAWTMIYGEFAVPNTNIAEYSGAFDLALSAQQKDDIVDGTSVIQLYNPADEQNGLHFVPDPEEPNDIKIPFAVTADWWNYLKQFGNDTKEQVVQAYNALNGLSGNSIGSISDAYDRLGIASVLSSAQSAAAGIASLTDSNVYPNSLTVADTISNSIPSSLTPETPDSGIDNESEQGLYKLPDLRDYFPFCIPFDLIDLLSCFVAEPETPSFVIALSTGEETVSGNMDLHIWDNIAGVIRTFELIGFTVGLILITRNIIRG